MRNVSFEKVPRVSLEQFFPELQFEFSDLDTGAIPHYLLRAITKLCREANVLRREAVICTERCINNYILEPEDCTDIVAIMSVCKLTNGCCGEVVRLNGEPCRFSCGTTTWFEYPNTIFFGSPTDRTSYKVKMSVVPRYDACEVDEILFSKYFDVIMDGVRAYLYTIADKPWSNVQRGAEARQRFELGIRRSATEKLTGNQRGMLRIRGPRHL